MKRFFSLFSIFLILMMCACQGNFGKVNLQNAVEIPENGVIKQSIIQQIKNENAIGVFTGDSNGLRYEWTIFGDDITTPGEINLAVDIDTTSDGDTQITLHQKEPFGFSALLSVYLDEIWNAQSATGYAEDKAAASVSLTGSKSTILNMTLDGSVNSLTIHPDELPKDAMPPQTEILPEKVSEEHTPSDKEDSASETASSSQIDNSYLSGTKENDGQVYTNSTVTYISPTPGSSTSSSTVSSGTDSYLSGSKDSGGQVYTGSGEKDKYLTDPIPAGKPKPVEPEDQEINKGTSLTCTFSIECSTILNNLDQLDPDKLEMVPSNGVILSSTTVTFYEGESVFDVLQRVCREEGIHMEASWTPIYNSAYVEGIHNLYEFDCGNLSGWMYRVNGWYPNYGCSRYQLKSGDKVEWRFTCDLGNDVGGAYAVGG